MKIIKIGDKEYTLEFTFEAADKKSLVQSMFNVMSGAYIIRNGANQGGMAVSLFDGVAEMVADVPHICRVAFHAALLEHNPVSEDRAKELMKQYMKENKLSFAKLYEELKAEMENDGFFDLSGITEMIREMNRSAEGQETENQTVPEKQPKQPQDHKKPGTSTN